MPCKLYSPIRIKTPPQNDTMKFDKPATFPEWTNEKTQSQIDAVKKETADMCRRMNKIDSEINVLQHEKRNIANRISNKNKYISQLENQLKETGDEK